MTQPQPPIARPTTQGDATTIYCPQGHPCVWTEAAAPGDYPDHPHGLPPMWHCVTCLWSSSEYPTYHDYKACLTGQDD
jgi:hypothetical protein